MLSVGFRLRLPLRVSVGFLGFLEGFLEGFLLGSGLVLYLNTATKLPVQAHVTQEPRSRSQ